MGIREGKPVGDILSLGLGVQSTAIHLMSLFGELPRLDFSVFADTGREKSGTMRYLDWLLKFNEEHNGPEILVVNKRNLFTDLLKGTNATEDRFASIPAFTRNDDGSEGILRRQCTSEYKIWVVDQAIREVYGLKFRERNIPTNIWKGISNDELSRINAPMEKEKWKTFIYPYIGYGVPAAVNGKPYRLAPNSIKVMSRHDIKSWYTKRGLPIPPKSACVFCPYTSDAEWDNMKQNEPDDFRDAVRVDSAIRDSSKRGVVQPIYLHRSLKPLDQVVFDSNNKLAFGDCSDTCHL